jgi:hypothetical protein
MSYKSPSAKPRALPSSFKKRIVAPDIAREHAHAGVSDVYNWLRSVGFVLRHVAQEFASESLTIETSVWLNFGTMKMVQVCDYPKPSVNFGSFTCDERGLQIHPNMCLSRPMAHMFDIETIKRALEE